MFFTYHHSDNSECLAGEHFIEALIPTWHLLDLQYRNVVALEGTVANLQASRSKKKKKQSKKQLFDTLAKQKKHLNFPLYLLNL